MSDTPPAAPAKNILRSVTFWVQILTLASALFPQVQKFMAENPVDFMSLVAAVNLIVRFVSSGKVILLTGSGENSGGSAGGLNLLALGGIAIGTAAVGMLPSCSPEYPLTGSVSYRETSTGSKAGLTFSPGQTPRASIRVPLRDSRTGDVIGEVNLHSGK